MPTLKQWGEKRGIPYRIVLKQFRAGTLPREVGMPERLPMTVTEWRLENGVSDTAAYHLWRGGYLDRFDLTNSRRGGPWWHKEGSWNELRRQDDQFMKTLQRRVGELDEIEKRYRGLLGELKKLRGELVGLRQRAVQRRVRLESAWRIIRRDMRVRVARMRDPLGRLNVEAETALRHKRGVVDTSAAVLGRKWKRQLRELAVAVALGAKPGESNNDAPVPGGTETDNS